MDSGRMEFFLRMDDWTGSVFKGFAARDAAQLPGTRSDGGTSLYVLNTDTEAGEGEHWCAFYADGNRGDFFDSYGLSPSVYGFDRLLATSGVRVVKYGTRRAQTFGTSTCAYYCLFFAHLRCRGASLDEILARFDFRDTDANERTVTRFVLGHGDAYRLDNDNGWTRL